MGLKHVESIHRAENMGCVLFSALLGSNSANNDLTPVWLADKMARVPTCAANRNRNCTDKHHLSRLEFLRIILPLMYNEPQSAGEEAQAK